MSTSRRNVRAWHTKSRKTAKRETFFRSNQLCIYFILYIICVLFYSGPNKRIFHHIFVCQLLETSRNKKKIIGLSVIEIDVLFYGTFIKVTKILHSLFFGQGFLFQYQGIQNWANGTRNWNFCFKNFQRSMLWPFRKPVYNLQSIFKWQIEMTCERMGACNTFWIFHWWRNLFEKKKIEAPFLCFLMKFYVTEIDRESRRYFPSFKTIRRDSNINKI